MMIQYKYYSPALGHRQALSKVIRETENTYIVDTPWGEDTVMKDDVIQIVGDDQ